MCCYGRVERGGREGGRGREEMHQHGKGEKFPLFYVTRGGRDRKLPGMKFDKTGFDKCICTVNLYSSEVPPT